jgi:hypothetical protein
LKWSRKSAAWPAERNRICPAKKAGGTRMI